MFSDVEHRIKKALQYLSYKFVRIFTLGVGHQQFVITDTHVKTNKTLKEKKWLNKKTF